MKHDCLTNAVRHGDGGPISVRVDAVGDPATIMVRNCSTRRAPFRSGTGLTVMRERAVALGGRLTAGPDADDWLVEAAIPA